VQSLASPAVDDVKFLVHGVFRLYRFDNQL
jgi:hypothetical protein